MTLTEIQDAVKPHGFSDQSTTTLNRWINDAYFKIVGAENWPFLEKGPYTLNTAASTAAATNTPADLGKVLSIISTSGGTKLARLSRDAYLARLAADGTADGTPLFYTIYAGEIRLYPEPSGTPSYNLYYLSDPAALSAGSDVPLIPERYHHLIVTGALMNGYRQFDDTENVGITTSEFGSGLQQMIEDVMQKDLDKTEHMGTVNTLGSLRQELRDAGFTDLGDSLLTTYLNDTLYDIASRQPWPQLRKVTTVDTVTDAEVLELPDDVAKPVAIFDSQGNKLTRLSGDYYADETSYARISGNERGEPRAYTIWGFTEDEDVSNEDSGVGPTIRLYPKPNAEYELEIWYIKNPDTLTAFSSKLKIPQGYRRLVILGALARCAAITTNDKLAAKGETWDGLFERGLERMQMDLLRDHYDNPDYVEDADFDTWGV